MTGFLDLSTSMTLNDLEPFTKRFLVNFLQYLDAAHIQYWIATKWLEIDQDNLRVKFSAFNVDFSSSSPDPLGSRRPMQVQAGVKDSYPPKKWLFYRNYLV